MKKYLFKITMILLGVFILSQQTSYAFEALTKSATNPIKVNFLANYDQVFQNHVFNSGQSLDAVFSTHNVSNDIWAITYGKRNADLSWTLEREILILERNLFSPRILFKDSRPEKLFFTKADPDRYRIFSTDCDNNFNCQNNLQMILEPNDSWEQNGVVSAFPYYKNGVYVLFYASWGAGGLQIGMATSNDGRIWQRCANNPILTAADGPFLFEENDTLYLFFHSPTQPQIEYAESNNQLSCDMAWKNRTVVLTPGPDVYDINHMVNPSVLRENGALQLYYTGRNNQYQWSLDLAAEPPSFQKFTTVLIPGFMSSWNKDAILHNKSVSPADWKLLSFVKEYDGLISSLNNLGYVENQDWVIFPYDWRQPVGKTADTLDVFLRQKVWSNNTSKKINIVGHSLGGLIGRIYTQRNKEKINKIITVGSPHQGVVQVYQPLENGELEKDDTLLWLSEKIILLLNKSSLESDKETIRKWFPVLFDLFPTFSFLKNSSNQEISPEFLNIKNDFLLTNNKVLSEVSSLLTSLYGEKDARTPAGYIVENNRVLSPYFDRGDYLVLSKSANIGFNADILTLDHTELVTKRLAVSKILSLLGIDYEDSQIAEGKKTVVTPSLIFLIRSPAVMKVTLGDISYQENDGLIFIPDANTGDYTLEVTGTDLGTYQILVGQIGQEKDVWKEINGEITISPPSAQTDVYHIEYDRLTITSTPYPTLIPASPIPTPIPPTLTSTPSPSPSPSSNNSNPSSSMQNTSEAIKVDQVLSPTPVQTVLTQNSISSDILGIQEDSRIKTSPSPTSFLKTELKNKSISYTTSPKMILFFFLILLLIGIGYWYHILRKGGR